MWLLLGTSKKSNQDWRNDPDVITVKIKIQTYNVSCSLHTSVAQHESTNIWNSKNKNKKMIKKNVQLTIRPWRRILGRNQREKKNNTKNQKILHVCV